MPFAMRLPGVVRDIGVTFGANVLSRVFTAASLVLVLKHLTVEEYGIVALVQSLMVVGSGLIPQGINWALIRILSLDEGKNTAIGVIPAAFAFEASAVVITVSMLVLFPEWLSAMFRTSVLEGKTVGFVGMGIISLTLVAFWASVLQGRQRFLASAVLTVVQAGLVVATYFALIASGAFALTPVLWVMVLVPLTVGVLGLFLAGPSSLRFEFRWGELFKVMRESHWFIYYTVILVVVGQLDVFMVARYCTLHDLGSYGLANRVYHVLMLSLAAIHTVLLPRLSADPSVPHLRSVMRKSLSYTIPIALLLTVPLIIFAEEVVLMLSNAEYREAVLPMRILLGGAAVNLVLSPIANIVFALHMESRVVLSSLVLLTLQYIGHTLLTSQFGPTGAAVTTVVSYAVFNSLILGVALMAVGRR